MSGYTDFIFQIHDQEATEEEGDRCEKECAYCELETFLCTFFQDKSGSALKLELF